MREHTGECILWPGAPNDWGYGQTTVKGKRWYVHRLAYTEFYGAINDGYLVRHRCHAPLCVNPWHLRQGTDKDNSDDKVRAGRQSKGEAAASAKLTEDDVRAIRADTRTQRAIAKDYGISQPQVCDIKSRKWWRHVD